MKELGLWVFCAAEGHAPKRVQSTTTGHTDIPGDSAAVNVPMTVRVDIDQLAGANGEITVDVFNQGTTTSLLASLFTYGMNASEKAALSTITNVLAATRPSAAE